ncbi:unnamed protein product [Oppiella nova]|uniref:Amino acid transporter transmembrane domain-containing protein n=1 Tax=Oppiella nova TaxID=334625 RepID=A0A7R9QS26_9ACAR|nr:unnamed protein product [Oppiella nova]CAG2173607.1 unnamed protein product [Oppiella nova]
MPLYRAVRNKHNFSKLFGVVNGAILIAISLYIAIGLLGYLKYGDEVESVITLSLPDEPVYDSVLLMYSLAVTVSYPVQMYVAIQQLWPRIESRLQAHKMDSNYINASNYILRTVLVIITYRKYDDSTIKVKDNTDVVSIAQSREIEITLTNVTKNIFGDYRCKVDYYSALDKKSSPKDSYHKVSFGRTDNGTFWLDNHNSALTYSSSLLVVFTSLVVYTVFGNNL